MADVSASAAAGSHDPRHAPVLRAEAIEALAPERGGAFIDGTYGAGGYSATLLAGGAGFVLGIDRDPDAVAEANADIAASNGRLRVVQGRFSDLETLAADNDASPADGMAFDFGVSSMQLDRAERGFSFRHDGPLDMRMDQDGMSAADFVNEAEPRELARVIRSLGEEQRARRIVDAIVAARTETRIERTSQLAEIVDQALGGRRGERTHPATKTFQAIRMHINDELGEIARGLAAAERVLKPGGRLAVVSFHSLEDRAVKRFLNVRAGRDASPSRHDPAAFVTKAEPTFRLLHRRAVKPGDAEIAVNPRARSARLRAAERLDGAPFEVDETPRNQSRNRKPSHRKPTNRKPGAFSR